MEKTLKSQIPIKILTTANSNDLNKSSVVLIKANQIDTEKLVGLAEKANAKIHALVNYSGASDVLNLLQNLSNQGFVEGSYVFINIEDVGNINEIQSIYSNLRQGGYYVGLVNTVKGFASLDEDDVKNISFYKMVDQNGDNSITVGDADGYINGLNIDLTGNLNQQPITRSERNTYTNVDVSTDSKGWVGIGQDTVLGGGKGFGYSTMGNDFNTVISPKGIIFRRPDAERMWELLKPKQQAEVSELLDHTVADEVKSATADLPNVRKQADEAVKFAESAIAASKVNSDAIVAQSEAISEAKSAMDSATAEIQQLKANAASDVAQIRADVAQVQNEVDAAKAANSASVDKLKSDIGLAQKDLDNVHDSLTKAQSAVEQNQKLINDSVAKINSDIAQSRQDIVTAQQANNDLAKQLDTYSKEAQEQGKTIKTIQDNQDGFSITIADVKGDVTKVSDTVDGLSAGLKDAQGNIASVKAQADQLNATLTDHSKDIAQLTATAKELSSTLEDANGRLSKVEQTASEQSTTLSDLQGNLTQVKQTADNLVTTLKDAQGNIDQIKQDAKGTLEQLSNAQGDITALQKDVSGIKLTIADHDKNIHTLQADSKTLKDDMADAKGNISSLQKTSTSLVSEFRDHDGRLSKVEQTATEHTSELTDTKGNIDKVTQKANALQLLLSDAQKNIQNIQLDAKGLHDTLTGQSNQLASLNVTLNNLDSKYSGITGDLQSKQTALSTEQQQTKDMLLNKADKSEVDNVKGTVNQVSAEQKVMADQINQKVSSVEYQTLKDKVNGMKVGTRNLLHHSDTFDGWIKGYSVAVTADKYLDGRIAILGGAGVDGGQLTTFLDGPYNDDLVTWVVYARAENAGDKMHTELWGGGGCTDQSLTTKWQAYKFSGHRNIDHPDFYLWGCVGNKGNIYVALPFAVVGNYIGTWLANPTDTITSINKNATAIDENSKLISLMAKQTEVDNIKGTAQQISSRLDVMADQIKSKVTSTDVNNIVDGKGYATTSTVQSLITQTAGTINESITNLDAKYNATVTQVQSLTASIDGLQSNVTNFKNDTSSQITQLSNVIQSKVSASDFNALKDEATWKSTDSIDLNTAVLQQKIFVKGGSNLPPGDYWWYVQVEPGYDSRIVQYAVSDRDNIHYSRQYDGSKWSAWSQGATESEITQLRDDINLRVKSGDLLSQINLTAGNTLIQTGKLYLDSSSVVFSGRAFIPSAAIAELDADKLTFYGNGSKASIGAGIAQYDQDKIKSTINLQYQGGFEIHSSNQLGSILTMHDDTVRLAVKSNGMANPNSPTDQYSGFYASTSYSLMNSYLKDGTTSGISIGSTDSGVNKDYRIHVYDGSNASNNLSKGISISTSSRFDVYAGNSQLFLGPDKAELRGNDHATVHGNDHTFIEGGNQQIYIHDGEVCIGMPGHESDKTSVHLRVFGWADFNGWMNVMGLSQTSLLSTKTRIEPLDTREALDKIMAANVETYQFKSDVAEGKTKRHASVIIDDVHDISQYYTPEEFISENRKGRDDGDIVGYLMGAVQELKKQLDKVKEKINYE